MPRYFITTSDHIVVLDDEGTVLPGLDALRTLLRTTLADILRDEGERTGVNAFTADASDEHGKPVMSAEINFSITDR